MLVIKIQGKDSSRAWTNWGGHEKKQLAGRLQSACPSLRLTERKRLAKLIVEGSPLSIPVEVAKYAESLYHILESTGIVASMREEEAISSHSNNALDLTFIDDFAYAQHGPVFQKRRLARPAGVADLNRWEKDQINEAAHRHGE